MKLLRPDKLAPISPYAYSAESNGLLFTAGACPLDPQGGVVSPGNFEAQAHQVMHNLAITLEASGLTFSDIIKSTIYVNTSIRTDLYAVWNVYAIYLGAHDAPSSLIGVSVLGYENQLVEVEVVASLTKE